MKQSTKRKFESDEYDETTDRSFTHEQKRFKEDQVNYNLSEVIFICSPSAEVDPSFITTLLTNYDRKVVINHHWAPLSPSSSLKVWYGALAMFSSEAFSRIAVDNIQRKHRFLKVLCFDEIIDILLAAELFHPKPPEETTRIVFRASNLFLDEQIPGIQDWLELFGKPSKAELYRNEDPDRVILVVDYPLQYQAYAAKIAMDGSGYKKIGFVSIEIVVTENGKQFDKYVKDEFKKCVAEKY